MGRIIAENKHTGKLYPVDSKAIYRVIYEVVDVLPTENIKTSVIYCIPIVGKENEYDMFLYIDSNWVSVGSGSIDLSDYYTKEETAELISDKMDLAPLNPTAEQIAAMPDGQPYRVSNAREAYLFFKGTGGGKFYNDAYNSKHYLQNGKYSSQIGINQDTYTETSPIVQPLLCEMLLGAANMPYLCVMSSSSSATYSRLEQTSYKHKTVSANPSDYFYPSEKCMVDYVEAKIGNIGTALDTLNGNLAEV